VCLCASLPVSSAVAEPHGPYASVAPSFPLLSFWRRWSIVPPAETAGRSAHPSVSTSCLPGELKAALAGVQARFGPVQVVSTHRPGARIRGGHRSHHATCNAVDFRPPSGAYASVATHLRQTWSGGLGTYSSGHIHIDTGPNYRWHTGGRRAKRR
jgi:hypothetical protein